MTFITGGETVGKKVEKGYQKHAWIILFVFAVLVLISAPINLLGTPPNPPSPERETGLSLNEMDTRIPGLRGYISGISRQLGNFLLAMGVLLMGIAAVPYRKGERWAWYTCWIIPVLLVIQIANSLATGGFLWQVDFGGLLVVLAGLLLPFRKFFPTK
jgi:hypothetical protein